MNNVEQEIPAPNEQNAGESESEGEDYRYVIMKETTGVCLTYLQPQFRKLSRVVSRSQTFDLCAY